MKHWALVILFISISIHTCTDNPFFGDEDTAKDKHFVSGIVRLNDGASPANAYVWVQDLGISSRCNSQGDFSLQIPRTPEYEGLNGSYTAYFYVGNYTYQTADVLVRNGQFEYGQQNITSEGQFDRTFLLSKLLDIKSSIRPDTISASINYGFTLILEMVNIDSFVSIITQVDRDQIMRGYFIRSLTSDTPAQLLFPFGTKAGGYKIDSMTTWETSGRFDPGLVSQDSYEIIPYIRVIQPGLPEELLLSLGEDVNNYALDYLNVPYSRIHAKCVVE